MNRIGSFVSLLLLLLNTKSVCQVSTSYLLEVQNRNKGIEEDHTLWILKSMEQSERITNSKYDSNGKAILVVNYNAPDYILFCCETHNENDYFNPQMQYLKDSLLKNYKVSFSNLRRNYYYHSEIKLKRGSMLFKSNNGEIRIVLYKVQLIYCTCIPSHNDPVQNKTNEIATITSIKNVVGIKPDERKPIIANLVKILSMNSIIENIPSIAKYLSEIEAKTTSVHSLHAGE